MIYPCPKPRTIRDPYYMAFVRDLRCCSCGKYPPSDPQHAGIGGQSIRADDTSCIPMCRPCHRAFERNHGKFKDWRKPQLRAWNAARIAETHEIFRTAFHNCNVCGGLVDLRATEGRTAGTWADGRIVCDACVERVA